MRFFSNLSKSAKNYLFKLEPFQIVIIAAVVLLSLLLAISQAVGSALAHPLIFRYAIYLLLLILLTFSRLTHLVTVGVRFSFFLLFCMTLTLGPLVTIILRLLSTPLRLWLVFAETPLKSFFRLKEERMILQMGIGILAILVMATAAHFITLPVIMSRLTLYYMILYAGWIIFLYIITLPYKVPASKYYASAAVAMVVNFFLVKNFGAALINFLAGL